MSKEPNNKPLPELLTIGEASEILKVHPNTLRNWDKRGLLKAKRIGVRGLRRYDRLDIELYLEKE
jgi:excisionase family DNA binding protein